MHFVITTREDPALPIPRLCDRGQLGELRAADLRFNSSEAAEFLNQVMDLNLSAEEVAALETRTEGWIAGLQLAALSMQGQPDVAEFIRAFAGRLLVCFGQTDQVLPATTLACNLRPEIQPTVNWASSV